MRFRYSFQKIFDLKSNEKTQAEWFLSTAVGKLLDEESSLTRLLHEKDELYEELMATAAESTTVSNLMLYQHYMTHIEQRIEHKHTDVRTAKMNVASKKEDLTAKMMEEKIWAQAKDRAKITFQYDALKKEQETLDEMATVRHKPMP